MAKIFQLTLLAIAATAMLACNKATDSQTSSEFNGIGTTFIYKDISAALSDKSALRPQPRINGFSIYPEGKQLKAIRFRSIDDMKAGIKLQFKPAAAITPYAIEFDAFKDKTIVCFDANPEHPDTAILCLEKVDDNYRGFVVAEFDALDLAVARAKTASEKATATDALNAAKSAASKGVTAADFSAIYNDKDSNRQFEAVFVAGLADKADIEAKAKQLLAKPTKQ